MHSYYSLAITRVIRMDKWEKRKAYAENVKKTKAQQKADARKKAKEEKKTPKAE